MDYQGWIVVMLFLGVPAVVLSKNVYVIAPNTLRLNADETIALAMDGNSRADVTVYVQDHPGKAKKIFKTVRTVQPGQPNNFTVHLRPEDFPPHFLTSPDFPKLVSLTAEFPNLKKEILIPISYLSGYMFVQTDKPIYTPKQTVFIRILPLDENARPSNERFQLQIKNPKNIIVEEKYFNEENRRLDNAFANYTYKFPTYPELGEWSVTVRYGHKLEQNSTVHFDLEEYVLPNFAVELKTPHMILPKTDMIEIEVKANYVYGKKVKGIATFRLGVKSDYSQNPVFFNVTTPEELTDGSYKLRIPTDELKRHNDIGWFPKIEGSHLVVEAVVVDHATGNKELATDSKCLFSKSPFVISFKRCLKDFKPGLTSVFEADINNIDGSPAPGIQTKIKAVSDYGKELQIAVDTAQSDLNGKVSFEIQPELTHKVITVTIETIDPRYEGSQAKGTFVQRAYESKNKAYIAISRSHPQRLRPNDVLAKDIHFHPVGMQDIYYLVTARGKILTMNKLPPGEFKNQRVEIRITHDMAPSFRVVVFTHFKNELVADSLKIDVEGTCNPTAEVSVTPEFNSKEPGGNGTIVIKGSQGVSVGLLAVDEAVYALSEKDLLTRKKMFDRLASHDLGCGTGGGLTVDSVLGNAGITIGSNVFTPSPSYSCVEIKRRKREAALDKIKKYSGSDRQCCIMGMEKDRLERPCEERRDVAVKFLDGRRPGCDKAFMECCRHVGKSGVNDYGAIRVPMGKKGGENAEDAEFLDVEFEEDFEEQLTVRKNFQETWIFKDLTIGSEQREELDLSLPHSITTWVIRTVSVSPTDGMCVSDPPQKLVSFKNIFLHLNLPYSVVRNEQVEIQATVFNYGDRKVGAVVYMYGVKHLCSGIQEGRKSEKKRLVIEAHSAASVAFPVIPLTAGDFPIKVVVLTPFGGDAIERTLHVVPEGTTKEIDISLKLDPTNQQKRKRRHIETELYSDDIDPTQNLQVTAIKLKAPEGFVPGTESCSISALGDMFGPVIETSINNPEGLLQKPHGCGEQNMMWLAPTLYSLRYLKENGKMTAESEEKGYKFIRLGYGNQLAFRKEDGSYAAFKGRPTSTWLTAFVMKVFCQAKDLVQIDENVVRSGVKWLITNQEPDGSYVEKHPVYHVDMVGGVKGSVPMTAFALIALEECQCDEENLELARERAVSYLEEHLEEVQKPLPLAIVAYALSLSRSNLKQAANEKLLKLAKVNEGTNTMYWSTENSAQDIETAGYALLNQLLFNDMTSSNSIVNWLNTKQLQSGSYKSTQDTVVALQAMSEYAIRARKPSMDLVANITRSNDRNFYKVMAFNDDNALLLQDARIDEFGGTLFINTAGHGVGSLAVKLRYNVIDPTENICKFNVTVKVTESFLEREKEDGFNWNSVDQEGKPVLQVPDDVLIDLKKFLDDDVPPSFHEPRRKRASLVASPDVIKKRAKRQMLENTMENSKLRLKIAICVKYKGKKDTEMSIVDVGIFSGFEPVVKDLKKLQDDPTHLIQRFEKSSRGVVFYLEKVPINEDYCFSFHVLREYIVGNTQMSVIKVYDYYNPDATCTKFYSPASDSPVISKKCDDGLCQCAESDCPQNTAFLEISHLSRDGRREKLENIFCEKYDYVWKGKLVERVKKEGGFLKIPFYIESVIRAGIEKVEDIEGEERTLLATDSCRNVYLDPGVTYLILGKNDKKYTKENGEIWYRYFLDRKSLIYKWTSTSDGKNKDLQMDLLYVTNYLREKECDY